MGHPQHRDELNLIGWEPPPQYDAVLRHVSLILPSSKPLTTPWTLRALQHEPTQNLLSSLTYASQQAVTSTLPKPKKPPKRRYKPVDRKVRPVPTYHPNPAAQTFKPIPLPDIEPLPHHPPDQSTLVFNDRITKERLAFLLDTIESGLLNQQEINLIALVVVRRSEAFAFTFSEKGTFKQEYYPDYEIATIEHTPWQVPPIKTPKAIESKVRAELLEQLQAGRFEAAKSSYRSSSWAFEKKSGAVRIVLDLQMLNSVVIRDSALPPSVEDFAESFIGHALYGSLDLFSGFDARILAKPSRPMTAFHSPVGPLQQCTLPMGYTNAPVEFQRDVEHALQEDNGVLASAFFDDVGIKGPVSRYDDKLIVEDSQVRQYIYEYATNLDRILARMIAAGITASGLKAHLAVSHLKIVGSVVSLEGWHLDKGLITKVLNWPECESVTEVRGFLGTVGCGRKWIAHFAIKAKPLTSLTKKSEIDFLFGPDAQQAMNLLKQAVTSAPVLVRIDYSSAKGCALPPRESDEGLIIVAVDAAALYGAGWVVYQIQNGDRRPAIFGSCTFSDRETRYSQPKAELYGVFRALKHLRYRIWGVHFKLEHDAKFLKEMIVTPDLPNAPMTRWIAYLQLFDFEMSHVPGEKHKVPDGLSRRRQSNRDSDEEDESGDELLDRFLGQLSAANPDFPLQLSASEPFLLSSPQVHTLLSTIVHTRRALNMQRIPYDSPRRREAQRRYQCAAPYGDFLSTVPQRSRIGHSASATFCLPVFDGEEPDDLFPFQVDRGIDYHPLQPLPNNRLTFSLLRNLTELDFVGMDFHERGVPVEETAVVSLYGQEHTVPIVHYLYSYRSKLKEGAPLPPVLDSMPIRASVHDENERMDNRAQFEVLPPPLRESIACIGHKFGTKDEDHPSLWAEIRHFIQTTELPERCLKDTSARDRFLRKARRFILEDGLLWMVGSKRSRGDKGGSLQMPRKVIESHYRRKELLAQAHDQCGHRGANATYELLSDRVYWPNMYDDVAYYVRSCVPCQKQSNRRPVIPYNPAWMTAMFRHWHIDVMHMPLGYGGRRYLVQATDSLSGWSEAASMREANSSNIARFLYSSIICRFSCVPYLTVDGGTEFQGWAEAVYAQYHVTVIVSNAYHPEGNGISERAHQPLRNGLMKTCGDDKSKWPLFVDAILFSSRILPNRSTGLSPYFMVYGVLPVVGFDIEDGTWTTLDWNLVRSRDDLLAIRAKQLARRDSAAEEAMRRARFSREKSIEDFHKKYGKAFSFHRFEVGMWVLRHETWLQKQHGNQDKWKWTGPYIIHEKLDNGSYVLRELDGTVIRGHVTQHRLALFFFRDNKQILKSVDSTRAYYDIQHYARVTPDEQAGRHPDVDWEHYSYSDRRQQQPAGRPNEWCQYDGMLMIYLPGTVGSWTDKFLEFKPHWRGTIDEHPAFQSYEGWSDTLFRQASIDTLLVTPTIRFESSGRFPLGYICAE